MAGTVVFQRMVVQLNGPPGPAAGLSTWCSMRTGRTDFQGGQTEIRSCLPSQNLGHRASAGVSTANEEDIQRLLR
jgi:hypothetical protein